MKKQKVLLIVPFAVVILGMIGYMLGEHYTVYAAFLASLKLLKVHLDPLPAGNITLELARWTGVLFFFSLIYTAVMALANRGIALIKSKKTDTVAVHGDSAYATLLARGLGRQGLLSDERQSYKAKTQVFLYQKDEDALIHYQKHADDFQPSQEVFLCMKKIRQEAVRDSSGANLNVVNLAEVKAVAYWQKHFCTKSEKIVMIGSGEQAVMMLYWGLLVNVFDVSNRITYYLIGDYTSYFNLHPEVKEKMKTYGDDAVTELPGNWTAHRSILAEADRIILCDDAAPNVEIASQILETIPGVPVHICVDSEKMQQVLDVDRCTYFGFMTEDTVEEMILRQGLERTARICNQSYVSREDLQDVDKMKEKTPEEIAAKIGTREEEERWKAMDAFTRGSNLACAVHSVQKRRLMKELLDRYSLKYGGDSFWKDLLRKYDGDPDPEKMTVLEDADVFFNHFSPADQDRLMEIEHIRWNRYHFLHNWHAPGPGEVLAGPDGRPVSKDPERRLHKCLVPFRDLPEEERIKDAAYYYTLPLQANAEEK